MMLGKKILYCLLISLCCTGCFQRFVMSKREIREYYKGKSKPTFFTIQNDSVRLFVAATGSDTLPPLLSIHGAPGAWYGSRNLLDDSIIQKQYHILAVDRPGYNKSTFKGSRKPVTSIETQAVAIHEALRLNRSFKTGIVLGSSFGGPIAAKIASMYPGEFHELVMLAPAIDPSKEKFWWFHPYIRYRIMRIFLPRFFRSATAEKFAHIEELKKLTPIWSKLSVHVTMVQGGSDHMVDPSNLDFAKRELRGKTVDFIYLPKAGHFIRSQYPEVVRSILMHSLQHVRPAESAFSTEFGDTKPPEK